MPHKSKVARIGVQLPRWFRVGRIDSIWVDGRKAWALIIAQSGEKNTALSIRRLLTLTPLEARRIDESTYLSTIECRTEIYYYHLRSL
jgi:hypothetical protein